MDSSSVTVGRGYPKASRIAVVFLMVLALALQTVALPVQASSDSWYSRTQVSGAGGSMVNGVPHLTEVYGFNEASGTRLGSVDGPTYSLIPTGGSGTVPVTSSYFGGSRNAAEMLFSDGTCLSTAATVTHSVSEFSLYALTTFHAVYGGSSQKVFSWGSDLEVYFYADRVQFILSDGVDTLDQSVMVSLTDGLEYLVGVAYNKTAGELTIWVNGTAQVSAVDSGFDFAASPGGIISACSKTNLTTGADYDLHELGFSRNNKLTQQQYDIIYNGGSYRYFLDGAPSEADASLATTTTIPIRTEIKGGLPTTSYTATLFEHDTPISAGVSRGSTGRTGAGEVSVVVTPSVTAIHYYSWRIVGSDGSDFVSVNYDNSGVISPSVGVAAVPESAVPTFSSNSYYITNGGPVVVGLAGDSLYHSISTFRQSIVDSLSTVSGTSVTYLSGAMPGRKFEDWLPSAPLSPGACTNCNASPLNASKNLYHGLVDALQAAGSNVISLQLGTNDASSYAGTDVTWRGYVDGVLSSLTTDGFQVFLQLPPVRISSVTVQNNLDTIWDYLQTKSNGTNILVATNDASSWSGNHFYEYFADFVHPSTPAATILGKFHAKFIADRYSYVPLAAGSVTVDPTVGSGSVSILTTPATGGYGTLSYQLQRRVGSEAWTSQGSITPGSAIVQTNLTVGTAYEYRVVVTDGAWPTQATVTTLGAFATPVLQATASPTDSASGGLAQTGTPIPPVTLVTGTLLLLGMFWGFQYLNIRRQRITAD